MGWVLWVIGVAIAIIIGLAVFTSYDVHAVTDQLRRLDPEGLTKALFIALGLVAISRFF